MAVDEAILQSYVEASAPPAPTLRLYGWHPPALSLGKGQDASRSHDPDYLRAEGIDLVRRPTGGLAVLHEHERTYAVAGALARPPFSASVLENYRSLSLALRLAMTLLGVQAEAVSGGAAGGRPGREQSGPACFDLASAYEIAVEGRKLIGSAQLRRRGAFLQHGSILLDSDGPRLARALGAASCGERFTDLRRLLGAAPPAAAIDGALVEAWERTFSSTMERGTLTAQERERAEELRAVKYTVPGWTLHGGAKNGLG